MSFSRILVAVDENTRTTRALDVGIALASVLQADLGFVYVVDSRLLSVPVRASGSAIRTDLENAGHSLLQRAAERVSGTMPPAQFIEHGIPAAAIVEVATRWNAALIVLGAHDRSAVARLLVGHTTEHVLRHAPCPVLVVPSASDSSKA